MFDSVQVGNELTKYGEVSSVMIFEVTTPGYEPEETVRIFVGVSSSMSLLTSLLVHPCF